jgi:hypothetical protein
VDANPNSPYSWVTGLVKAGFPVENSEAAGTRAATEKMTFMV